MNLSQAIAITTFAGIPWAAAQNTVPHPENNSLFENAGRILHGKPEKLNEVTVVLPPPVAADTIEKPSENAGETPAVGEMASPKVDSETGTEDQENQAAITTLEPPEEAPQAPEPGLAVRVERLQSGSGEIDPAQVKLRAPFPAKLLARTPAGWRIEASEQAPPIDREVELSPGKNITLSIRPHLLVAEADGATVFEVAEPGYAAPLGYRQDATVGAILSNSIRQLEQDSQQLGSAIEQLQQLLVSLPQPDPVPAPAPASQSANKTKQ